MASNGGTLHGVPSQSSGGHHICSHCGLLFDSSTSLQVHTHYQHETSNRWGGHNTGTPPINDSENNNQPPGKQHHIKANSNASPQHQLSGITSAAADSSDNQPATPQPAALIEQPGTPYSAGTNSPFVTDMHFSGHYIHGYEQYYHHPAHNMDYGLLPPPHHLNNHHLHQQEYKAVPSQRYHPYLNNGQAAVAAAATSNHLLQNTGHAHSQMTQVISNNNNNINGINGLSPRIVSSSSPSVIQQQVTATGSPNNVVPPGQPTPSPSPKQCDKCGMVCETNGQLIEHYATMHQAVPPTDRSMNDSGGGGGGGGDGHGQFSYPSYVKEEPTSDILDLDSQKMVYPNNESLLPSMHSLHHLQSMHRHHMMWNNEGHGYMAAQDIRSPYYPAIKPEFIPLKTDYPPTPPTKNDYHSSGQIKAEFGAGGKPEFPLAAQTVPRSPVSQNSSTKSFGTDGSDGNQMPTSPQDFPSTTTPQENGGSNQFRTFEAATSSLPNSTVMAGKGSTWKSNEARRPKTYNCTACNKWFTSSGHLKRHYNTTLHKNAVKSSGHPDPATLPISMHHHPGRDPNYTGKGRRSLHHQQKLQQQQQQQQQQQMLQSGQHSDTTQSPEYTPQYTLPGFAQSSMQVTSQSSQQGFQQYANTSNLHTTAGGPPNGLAGPSVLASQPRGLLNYSNNNNMASTTTSSIHSLDQQPHQQLQQLQLQHQQTHISTTTTTNIPYHHLSLPNINSMAQSYNTISPLIINTTIPLYQQQHIQPPEAQTYHHTIGNMADNRQQVITANNVHGMDNKADEEEENSCFSQASSDILLQTSTFKQESDDMDTTTVVTTPTSVFTITRVESGAHDQHFQGDTVPPFSPDVPESSYHMLAPTSSSTASLVVAMRQQCINNATSQPKVADAAPYSPAPCSPSITSTEASTTTTLLEHSVSNQRPNSVAQHRCDQCDKVFNKACYLTQHNKTFHSGDKPFKCQRCGKRFSNTVEHVEHQAKHGGEKPFKCEVCPKQFNHKTDLRRHMCLHSGTKPYHCELCNKGFIRKDHMVKHGETHRKKTKSHDPAKASKKYQKASSKMISSTTNEEYILP